MSKDTANENINEQTKINKNKKPLIAVIIIAVIIIGILIGIILYLLPRPEAKPYNNVVTPDNVDEVISQMEEEAKTPVGSYEVSMNTDWVFPDSNSASTNAFVENAVTNQNTVYFTIALADDPETDIFKSPYLEVGSHLADIKLDTAPLQGIHDAIITYHLVDEEFNDISSVSMYMTITIEK